MRKLFNRFLSSAYKRNQNYILLLFRIVDILKIIEIPAIDYKSFYKVVTTVTAAFQKPIRCPGQRMKFLCCKSEYPGRMGTFLYHSKTQIDQMTSTILYNQTNTGNTRTGTIAFDLRIRKIDAEFNLSEQIDSLS